MFPDFPMRFQLGHFQEERCYLISPKPIYFEKAVPTSNRKEGTFMHCSEYGDGEQKRRGKPSNKALDETVNNKTNDAKGKDLPVPPCH